MSFFFFPHTRGKTNFWLNPSGKECRKSICYDSAYVTLDKVIQIANAKGERIPVDETVNYKLKVSEVL